MNAVLVYLHTLMPTQETSITAYGVVCGMAKLARLPRWKSHISDEMMLLNKAFMERAKDSLLKRLMSRLTPQLYIRMIDTVLVPGMVRHFLFRKKFIEDQVLQFLKKGGDQVVVLGGGFDTLSLRVSKQHSAASFFEIVNDISFTIPRNCFFVEADLSNVTVGEALSDHKNFNPDAPTMVIIEGVLMYLSEADVQALFANMRTAFNHELTVAFGAIAASDDEGALLLRIFNSVLGRKREATKWFCPQSAVPQFMEDLGYQLHSCMPYKALQKLYLDEAEIKAVPEEDENYYIVTKRARS
jgi:methyltransferase (TIGR00027 family)